MATGELRRGHGGKLLPGRAIFNQVTITLAPYQETAVAAMVASKRFLLADSPGCGKTYPAIAAASVWAGRKLVVCPAHLMHQWQLSLDAMDQESEALTGTPSRKHSLLDKCLVPWLVASYHALGAKTKSGVWRYPQLQTAFDVVVFDEAHALRGPKSKWTQAALRMTAETLYLLTGTPEISHAGNLYVLAAMLGRLSHRSYWKFIAKHCHSSLGHFGRTIGGLKDPEAFHREVFSPDCYLRRSLAAAGLDVGEPVFHDVRLRLDPAAQAIHQEAKLNYRTETGEPMFDAGKVAHYLRQVASWPPRGRNPKLAYVRSVLEKHPNERFVVLTWYRAVRDSLSRALLGHNHRAVITVRAEDTPGATERALVAFKATPGSVLVGTLPHLKEGIDGLQVASHMMLYERSWLHAENEQAIARLARRGQTNVVHVYRPVVDNTLDATVALAAEQREKRTLRDLLGDRP